MKAVLISIQPKWCELIASGKKTIEVRKTRPKIATPFKVYVYMTKHKWIFKLLPFLKNRFAKVIGEFVCDDIIVDERGENADVFSKYAQLSLVEQKKYGANKPLFGWHITDLKIYDKPKGLEWFRKCHKCEYGPLERCKRHEFSCDGTYKIVNPPQSWCYVEELE